MNDQKGNGYYMGVEKPDIAGQTEVVAYDDFAPPIFEGELYEQACGYNKILNPKTGRWVKINGIIGKKILKSYIKQVISNHD